MILQSHVGVSLQDEDPGVQAASPKVPPFTSDPMKKRLVQALDEHGVKYAIRIPANENLERDIAELLKRPWAAPVINQWSGTRAFCTKRPVGKRRDGWWRRWSSTSGNYSRESALSSRIWACRAGQ